VQIDGCGCRRFFAISRTPEKRNARHVWRQEVPEKDPGENNEFAIDEHGNPLSATFMP
jgi:hypothetical protein